MKKITLKHKQLVDFVKNTKIHIDNVDSIMKTDYSAKKYKLIAKEMNRFNFQFDKFLHFGCNIPLDEMQSVLDKSFKINNK